MYFFNEKIESRNLSPPPPCTFVKFLKTIILYDRWNILLGGILKEVGEGRGRLKEVGEGRGRLKEVGEGRGCLKEVGKGGDV